MTTITPSQRVPCPYCKGNLSTLQCSKAACGHCQSFTLPIPQLSWLWRYYPDVTPNLKIDRGTEQNPVLSCQLCGLIDARKKSVDAEVISEPAKEKEFIQRMIAELDSQYIANPEMDDGRALHKMQIIKMGHLENKLRDIEVKIFHNCDEAWMEYWGTWGKGEYEIVKTRNWNSVFLT